MLIESIELDNFKSFGNKRKITFRKGLTVISGPNGSGKSNIGDAMLFVLGVRSSKTIRAERLSDLIHKASNAQRQRNSCRVSLIIDTEREDVPEEQRRINITRELELEGGDYRSTYFINGARSKRSDVEHLLDVSQIYLDSYSFVLQGDINNLIEMSGTERRKLLESIAGIESYNNQIEKAETDIRGVAVNLEKIGILRDDHNKRLDQLQAEKAQAEKYNILTSEIKNLKTTILTRQLTTQTKEMEGLSRQVELVRSEIGNLEKQKQSIKEKIDSARQEIAKQQELRERSSSEESREIRGKIEQARISIGEVELDIKSLDREDQNLETEISGDSDDITSSNVEIRQLEERIAGETEKLAGLEKRKKELDERFSDLLSVTGSSSKEISELQGKLVENDSRMAEARKAEQDLNSQVGYVESEKNSVLQRLSVLEEKEKSLESEIKDAKWRIRDIEESTQKSQKETKSLSDRYYKLRNTLESLNTEKSGLTKRHSEAGKEYERISASSNARFGPSSRALSAIAAARSNGQLTGIHGTVRELLSFDEKYALAIEAAAGNRLNSLVVDTDEVAEKCLNVLKREKAGRITLLPLSKMSPARPRGKAIMVRNSGESLGYIFENVKYGPEYESIIWYCFQDTLIMADVPTARKHMGGVRLVTMEGDIFDAGGAITGGYADRKSPLATEARLRELSAELSTMDARLAEISQLIADANDELDIVTSKLHESSRSEGTDSGKISFYRETIVKNDPLLAKCRGEIEKERLSLSGLDGRIAEFGKQEGVLVDHITELEKTKEQIFEKMKSFSPEMIEEKNSIEKELHLLRDDLSGKSSDLTGDRLRLENLQKSIEAANQNILKCRNRKSEIGVKRAQEKQKASVLREELAKLTAVEDSINEQVRAINARILELEKIINAGTQDMDRVGSEVTSKSEIITDFEVRSGVLRDRIALTESQILESGGSVMVTSMGLQEMKSAVSTKENEVTAMGAVNLKAIEEYQTEKDFLASLDGEMEKLRAERRELEKLEESLIEQKKVVFMRLFRDINLHMNSIYYALSDGGEASLVMSDEDKPLESEINIRAKPKGSNFNKIGALSGGEKSLTAMAFIMSVQRINPSPVYYLDEVDMFLDGSNAERIGKMLKENSKTSQVLIVSLRKAMLKYADQIVGVTTFDDENTEVFTKSFSEVPV